ncbi:MAG: anti-sigma factor, partial [Mycobacterium sp.]|uniref:anti-sigma factor n=1 Tax=Mycobacterium sp. TaxID=1785 RepID=UPI003BAE59C5
MTEPTEFELLELATPYALHAVSDAERAAIERQVAAAPPSVAEAFRDEVRAARETMTAVSAATAAEPPTHLRAAVLAAVQSNAARRSRWQTAILAAAAAIVVALAAFGAGIAMRPSPTPSMAEQIMAAPDVRTVSGQLGGGTATVVFSRDRNAGVLVMNNVPPPSQGTVYQMWL